MYSGAVQVRCMESKGESVFGILNPEATPPMAIILCIINAAVPAEDGGEHAEVEIPNREILEWLSLHLLSPAARCEVLQCRV